ncbi:hypothetical protein [Pseudomonas turukhanskensis]|uniref:Uncharacterized protein n=1 Tax=Pseudomonas turukhanskensis TaxID=1806536 RepID=A0A9W6K5U3_9PSED|nr:hypothetical protein [Pseudomonas turukhanskensis]GLK88544.1 hypothetical protein GCM10017655_16060 [Pseudomonas turukhanskensis]
MDVDEAEHEEKWARKRAKTYASRRRKNQIIRKMERQLAQEVCQLRADTKYSQCELQNVRSSLEWLISWRIKNCVNQTPMWCDGIETLTIAGSGGIIFHLDAQAIIGPESDVTNLYRCQLKGSFVLSRNLKEIKQYCLRLTGNDHVYVLSKNR